jgi:methyl-accepting chemotaxis protein
MHKRPENLRPVDGTPNQEGSGTLNWLAMLELAPINIMYADRTNVIKFVNRKSLETLRRIEKDLPVRVENVLGSSIDVFHKNPAHQQRMLADDRNLPHRALITVGSDKLDLLVTPIYDDNKNYVGAMVTWDIVTDKLLAEQELARIKSMMDNAPINVMSADLNLNINYINPKSKETLKKLEKHLPLPVEKMVGHSIDIFHKNPDHQRKMLADDRRLPHRAKIRVGPETLDLLVTAIYDNNRKYIGTMVTWDIITNKIELVRDIGEAAKHLAAASAELNATASQMATNAERTNGEANSAASGSEEVSRGVQAVATNTEEMVAAIKEIARNAGDASAATHSTAKEADATNVMISKLGESSKEIGDVVKVISSIAQQTNLLALNATIEAARAGEAGRGFAVVANEVKELAKQTAKATEDITGRIGSIQKDTGSAVTAIGSITERVQKINSIATAIAAAVEEQQATTAEVSRVVQESAKGIQSISTSIKSVSTVAQETKSGASQVLDAAKSLSGLAAKLQELVGKIEV